MRSHWSETDAEQAIERYTKQGATIDVALRTYSTRLLGAEPQLVIHGGGNTSVKTVQRDLIGDFVDVLCVKGSGWDMATIEPPGLPAVRLDPLLKLMDVETLSDEEMVDIQRANLLDPRAPNPSVETLLHAFLPHRYIDHTHANALLALTDQPDGEALCEDVYGKTMGLVPYIMPGFALARKAVEVYRAHPNVEGLILLKHGIFTFGETARQAYERMIEKVSQAEQRITGSAGFSVAGVHLPKAVGKSKSKSFQTIALPAHCASMIEVAPIIRGAAAIDRGNRAYQRFILDFRTSARILDFVNGHELKRYSQLGTATPDHVIRTKPKPLIAPVASADDLQSFAIDTRLAMAAYQDDYRSYFERHNQRYQGTKKPLDAVPRVVLVPGVGLFGLGASLKEARIAADLAETNIEVITAAERMGQYEVISEADIFDIEYWSLEQAKLGQSREKPLARHIAVITGGGSGIGAATAAGFRAHGAEVAVLDLNEDHARDVASSIGGIAIQCDVCDQKAIRGAFNQVVSTFGGLDIVVSNAGAAWQGRIGDVDERILRESFELNFWGHQRVAQAAVGVMRAQGTGGCLLFNASKQAVNPGPDFGPYGLPKAATLALMRQYALDHGRDGIRANAVNADRIRSGLLTEQMIVERASARGVTETAYMSGNLLNAEVTANDVADAFVHLALSPKTSGAVLTVDGGNIAAALR
ncbi:MAG: bifunctional aldolase/short-chain dehydrogenase [Hyphomicrobiales bacterium]|nr:bifunctional aldolase/short-chain dehydrogenase [Hyphomicrobiales bacterium]